MLPPDVSRTTDPNNRDRATLRATVRDQPGRLRASSSGASLCLPMTEKGTVKPVRKPKSGSTERRRSRTDLAVGYTTAQVLKVDESGRSMSLERKGRERTTLAARHDERHSSRDIGIT